MASHCGEIITVQSGHYANFIGSHWWNLQQASFCFDPLVLVDDNCVNHDVLFREGQTLLGDCTFTPRLISFDLKERMGTLKKEGVLYDLPNQASNIPWQEKLSIEQSEKAKPNAFLRDLAKEDGVMIDNEDDIDKMETEQVDQEGDEVEKLEDVDGLPTKKRKYDLDEFVSVWSDFLKVHYHPKTMCLVDNLIPNNAENAVDSFIVGQTIAKGVVVDEMEDKLHFFSEECDHLQAFQMFVDPYDQFAGVGNELVQMIVDDFSAKSILCCSVIPTSYKNDSPLAHKHRVLSSVISLTSLHEQCSLLLPLSCSESPWTLTRGTVKVPYLDYKINLNYHTSAILAAVLDTATMPLRSKIQPLHVRDLCASLSFGSRKFASVVGSLPLPVSPSQPLLDYLMGLDRLPWQSFSSLGSKCQAIDPQIQQLVVRGATGPRLRKSDYKDLPRSLSHCENAADLLSLYLKESMIRTRSYTRSYKPSIVTMDPYPHIFSPEIDVKGELSNGKRNVDSRVECVPAIGGIQSHPATGEYLKTLVQEVRTISLNRMAGFFDQTFERDDFNEYVEKMLTIIEEFSYGNKSDSDSENDDA